MRILLIHPGARWATADVEAGLADGLRARGVQVERYPLDVRIDEARHWLSGRVPCPSHEDVLLYAALGAVEQAFRQAVDAVVVVSAVLLHPDVIALLRRAGRKVYVVFTESPYDHADELRVAALVDGGWTHERAALADFQAVNPAIAYLPHGWRPGVHRSDDPHAFLRRELGLQNPIAAAAFRHRPVVASHDVVFVGSGFPERISFFNAIDWTGIDLGLYGTWEGFGLKDQVAACIRGAQIGNDTAAALYRNAKIGLNLYRRTNAPVASLNPRAYELAACGVFFLSPARDEHEEVFGDLLPTFSSPQEAERLIRSWLAQDAKRQHIASKLPELVTDASWTERARLVVDALTPPTVYASEPIPMRPWPGRAA